MDIALAAAVVEEADAAAPVEVAGIGPFEAVGVALAEPVPIVAIATAAVIVVFVGDDAVAVAERINSVAELLSELVTLELHSVSVAAKEELEFAVPKRTAGLHSEQ